MSGAIRVLLPPTAVHVAPLVVAAGAVPVVDATGATVPEVPAGAWVRTRPGRPAPGTGPVILAELGAAIPGRETWLETCVPREVPAAFAGLVLKGREAGGMYGEEDGLVALARCPDPSRVLLDAGVGPRTAAAAAALGAAGVLLVEPHLACPELGLPVDLAHRLDLPDDEVTCLVQGLRVAASPTAPVLRELVAGSGDPWALGAGLWRSGDPAAHLWLAGQGLALAKGLAERYGSLDGLIRAYVEAWSGWREVARAAVAAAGRPVGTTSALVGADTAAAAGGAVGSAVLWERAWELGRPVTGGPLRAMIAVGAPVAAGEEEVAAAVRAVPDAPVTRPARSAAPSVAPRPAPKPTPAPAPAREEAPARATSAPATSAPATSPLASAAAEPVAHGGAVAIVGIGCRFPGGSSSPAKYWENLLAGRYAISEVPKSRWDAELFWDADKDAPDKTYAKIGGFLTDFEFDPKAFRIPPNVARQVDPVQQLTLVCVADALRDAGLQVNERAPGKAFDRERCAVILGNSLGGEMSDKYAVRVAWPEIAKRLVETPPFCDLSAAEQATFLGRMEEAYKRGLPVVDEDSMPGELANVIAGRITNAFDLGGANFTVDAACASSMAAIQTAVKSLLDGESDLALTGGADRSMNIATYVKFCKIGALSPDHSAPFDRSANGFVMGEGCGILVLKRYEDALRDGDRVYAVIRGIGGSSDGKGKGITAPNPAGQVRALRRAWGAAGLDPAEATLIEAHGTSTLVGDKVEIEALNTVIGAGRRRPDDPIRIGSVKSMIGHLKSAAGAASVIKVALALHHGVLPPSANFRDAREDVPFGVIPVRVQTRAEPWPAGPRLAGVSAFGFGGTNFHVVLEGFTGRPLPAATARTRVALPVPGDARPATTPPPAERVVREPPAAVEVSSPPAPPQHDVPAGLWATSGRNEDELLENLRALRDGRAVRFHGSHPLRIAGAPVDAGERKEQLDRAISGLEKRTNPDLLRARGIALEDVPFDRKLVFLFTGQGSQYLDMGLDLASEFPVVAETFAEADRILAPSLGKPITDFIRLAPGEDEAAKDDVLRRTEYSQPATLTVDVALLRLLVAYGALPDMVAGHSLGEYGAAVAAGVMSFEQALYAVTARGREMANIRIDDPGKMAGIATGPQVVDEVLADIDGYVIAANKNCPSQTVIAGASDAVDEACERFKAKGVTVHLLPVSHAFHSRIVEPASTPLRGVLQKLGLRAPQRPITTNVTGDWYPTGEGAVDRIIDLLARQISGPVEWTAQMERMYADDGRVFVEVGPKRALSGFTVAILKRRPHRALFTNHPKRGGVASFRDALAQLLVLGIPLRAQPLALSAVDLFAAPEPRRATTQRLEAVRQEVARPAAPPAPAPQATADLREGILGLVARSTGYAVAELDLDYELEADLGIDTVKQAELFSAVRDTYGIAEDASFSMAEHRTLRSLVDWAASRTGARRVAVREIAPPPAPSPSAKAPAPVAAPAAPARPLVGDDVVSGFLEKAARAGLKGGDARVFADALLPAVQGLLAAAFEAARPLAPPAPAPAAAPVPTVFAAPAATPVRVFATGAAIGLPGGRHVFDDGNFDAILAGQNRISRIGAARSRAFLDLGLVRLVKDPLTGQGSFLPVTRTEEVIRLAGVEAAFDLTEWGVDAELVQALDISSQLAFAAGFEALRDAQIPLVRTWKTTATGKRVPGGWQLPEPMRDRTGVVFGSCFPGYDYLVRHVKSGGRDAEGRFDRRFLFQVLAMGHSQFAQHIGARGPNTQVNAACASTAQALAIAEDWLKTGRCDRVIVVGADDVTSESLLPWIGGGFMAAGAASTHDVVEETALPFDRRRHGLVLGMGAAGIVLERQEAAAERGVVPLAEQLNATIVNSAFHGTRLDVEHIAHVMRRVVEEVCRREGVTPERFAEQAFFMSHETYTPARGGSAQAEVDALRAAFGEAARRIVITNTKGFTGHPMGAGIEDGVVLKALQHGRVPPIANLREPDEQLGDLQFSRGQRGDYKYALRLAAGFGSQLAITVHRAVAKGEARIADAGVRARWLREVTGYAEPVLRVEHRTLRVLDAGEEKARQREETRSLLATPAPAAERIGPPRGRTPELPPRAAAPPKAPAAGLDAILRELTAIVAEKTGYGAAEIEPDFELEADLGVDTVKQAEILSVVTERFGVARDESFRIADHPTLRAIATWVASRAGGPAEPEPPAPKAPQTPAAAPKAPTAPAAAPKAPPAPPAALPPRTRGPDAARVLADLTALVAEKTGYAPTELEPGFELEADLGVDTVKQAEILSELTARYGLVRDETFKLADHPTLERLAAWVAARAAAPTAPFERLSIDTEEANDDSGVSIEPDPPLMTPDPPPRRAEAGPAPAAGMPYEAVLGALLGIVAEKTGYAPAELEPGFELEADLGVDTVKQAEILSEITARLGVGRDESFKLADAPTLEKLARHLHGRLSASAAPTDGPAPAPAAGNPSPARPAAPARIPLPDPFRLRRPVLAELPASAPPAFTGTATVLGDTPLAKALRALLASRGVAEGPGVLVDAGAAVLESFAHARAADGARPGAWLCVTRIGGFGDGDFGPAQGFTDGARAGFAKALGREWGVPYEVLDVHPWSATDRAAEIVADELGRVGVDGPEVFVNSSVERARVVLREEAIPEPADLPPDAVVLLTGGGRGITAAVARELARRGPVALALCGRSAVPTAPLDEAAARDRARAELAARGERVVPAKIEAAMEPLRRGEEVRRTIEDLRAAGAHVAYFRADLASAEDCRRLVREVTDSLGAPTVVIHGAGVEESRKIADKDEEKFRRVFDGKALGGRAILEAIGPDVFFVSMGSVAGRFGNPGQVDYSAANDALARACHARPGSLHVDWTAWDDVGMAVRGGMKTLLSGRGVDLLPAGAGAALLADLVARRVAGEVVCAGRLGDFEARPSHPLLDTLERVEEGGRVVVRATRALSKAGDPWILDHAIEGVPVLPGVVGLELMAAAAAALSPGGRYLGARNVRFDAPVKVHRDDVTTVRIEAEPGPRPGEVVTRLVSVRNLKTGRVRRTEHFSAVLVFGLEPAAPPSLPSAFLPEETIARADIYRRFFHGPAFQVLTGVVGVSEDGLMAEASADSAAIAPGLLSAPLLVESALQAAGLHRMVVTNGMGLPLGMEELVVFRAPAPGEAVLLMVQQDGDVWHVDADGPAGPLLRLRGFSMIEKGPLPEGDRFPVPPEGRPSCFPPSSRASGGPGSRTARAHADEDAADWLLPEEVAALRARGTEKRVRDRIAGRIAAKRALAALTGVHPHAIRVDTAASGAPVPRLAGPPVWVSISHREGRAVAVASRAPVGVDLERVEARPASFAADWLTDSERALCGDDPLLVTLCWAAKEAVLKWRGTGMAESPASVIVAAVGEGTLTLAAPDGLEADWERVGDEVVVTVRAADARAA